jgi:cell wall-associated protease
MSYSSLFIGVISTLLSSCISARVVKQLSYSTQFAGVTIEKPWHYKDLTADSIPGISLERAKQEQLKNKKGKEVLLALIDGDIDTQHEMIKDYLWENEYEIPNNRLDDDLNGYIDDLNGWNFWGNRNTADINDKSQYEYVRIINKLDPYFKNKSIDNISSDSLAIFQMYLKAKKRYQKEYDTQIVEMRSFISELEEAYYHQKDTILKVYPYLTFQIDSIKKIKSDNKRINTIKDNLIYYLNVDIENGIDGLKRRLSFDENCYLNFDFKDRFIVNDDVNDLLDVNYGNPKINYPDHFGNHGTSVLGQITSIFKFVDNKNLKIMTLLTAVYGNEHDKDIALAIKYAVNNGAQIIVFTMSKEFSSHNEWVKEAIEYAASKDVLIIKAAGNYGYNLSLNDYYPNDKNKDETEFVNNFINVGASTKYWNKNLIADFSCYSNKEVDIMAPGSEITIAIQNNKYEISDGTSFAAPIVAGIAALLKSYYPDLKAHEIKEILMESGTVIDLEVEIKDDLGNPKLVPFSSLSKSGKIVNAYNALIWAEHYTKEKKRKTK